MKPEIWDMFMKIGLTLGAVFTGVVTYFLAKVKKKKRKEKDIVSPLLCYPTDFWMTHTKIQESLTELRLKVDCARTQLTQFHNSGEFFNGTGMKRLSLTHESLASGVAGEQKRSQDLLMSMFMVLLKHVKDNNVAVYYTDDLEESYTKQYLESSNTIAYGVLPIKQSSVIIGFVMIHWCREAKAEEALKDFELIVDWMERTQTLIEVELTNKASRDSIKV